MKRFICTALAATMALSLFSACKPQEQTAVKITPEPEVSAVSEVTKAPEPTTEPTEVPTNEPTEAPTAEPTEVPTAAPTNTPEPGLQKLDVPVYPDEQLFMVNSIVELGFDASSCYDAMLIWNTLKNLLEEYPTGAIRKASTGEEYLIYESESGYREYVFLELQPYGNDITKGYPLVIGEVHSFKDFEHLNKGDTIDDVAKVDDIAALYKRKFIEFDLILPYPNSGYISGKRFVSTIHYLTDGILKIKYSLLEDGTFVIADIIHSPDYTLIYEDWDAWDVVTNYRIEPIDLPKK